MYTHSWRICILGALLVLGACAVPVAPVSAPASPVLAPVRLCYSSAVRAPNCR